MLFLLHFFSCMCIKVAFLADIQYESQYSPLSNPKEGCHVPINTDSGEIHPYGQYLCGSTSSLLDSMIKTLKQELRKDDVIFILGDSIIGEFNHQDHYRILHELHRKLSSHFKGHTYPVLGGTDLHPDALVSLLAFRKHLKYFADAISIPKSIRSTFLKGGFYSFTQADVVFITINTLIYSPGFLDDEDDPLGQIAYLQKQLEHARASKQHAIIVQYDPIMISLHTGTYSLPSHRSQQLFKVYRDYVDVIRNVHAAHYHRDEFKLIHSTEDNGIPMFILPSVSPLRLTNPAFRIVTLGPIGDILDYDQFYFMLAKASQISNPRFHKQYTFSESYGAAISASAGVEQTRQVAYAQGWCTFTSMKYLLWALERDTELWSTFWSHSTALYYDRMQDQICAVRTLDSARFRSCINAQ
ncbi:Acid sphingomyelinase [Giardia muris]|uniref:Acid sphingomyelinase n=1 Tax=Giardia muris TaxID=5742 RepID=A0A4Z1T930_GIAMU|nr:Acid sphingomyelinase [Giardia muris]|eukprot:TNJ30653.1 Acid sphingomyelinase [Giardia muris]